MNLDIFKIRFIRQLKARYSTGIILNAYPIHAQLNAGLNGGDVEMKAFIDSKRTDIDSLESAIEALTDTTILDNLELGVNDTTRKAYILNHLPAANTDEKQLLCLLALQDIKVLGGF
jgi:hypothetical protein